MVPTKQEMPRSARPLKRLPHLELLIALVCLLVLQSFLTAETVVQRSAINVLLLLIIVSAIRSHSRSPKRSVIVLLLGLISFVLSCWAERSPSPGLVMVIDACYVAVFAGLLLTLCENVFRDGRVDVNRILGAICIYLVLGLLWAFLYAFLERAVPGSFRLQSVNRDLGAGQGLLTELMYFSNVTLTTLGYGDIVPVSKPARTFAVLQAIFGQLYVAIVMARLVGLHISERR